jgi:hypothetical protein
LAKNQEVFGREIIWLNNGGMRAQQIKNEKYTKFYGFITPLYILAYGLNW